MSALPGAEERRAHSTQNIPQTYEKAIASGPFCASVTTRPIPSAVKGAADSMSIAATLVYVLDSSGASTSRVSERMRKRRTQMSVVTSTLRLTLSETHGTPKFAGFPFSRNELGRALSTIVMITRTARASTIERRALGAR